MSSTLRPCAARGRILSNSSVALMASTAARAACRCSSGISWALTGTHSTDKAIMAVIASARASLANVIFFHSIVSLCPVMGCRIEGPHAVRARNDCEIRKANEESVFDNARDFLESVRKGSWLGNAAKRCVDNEMSAIGDERAVSRHPGLQRARQAEPSRRPLDGEPGRSEAEGIDLHGQRKAAELPNQLGLVGDHDHAARSRGHDLL